MGSKEDHIGAILKLTFANNIFKLFLFFHTSFFQVLIALLLSFRFFCET